MIRRPPEGRYGMKIKGFFHGLGTDFVFPEKQGDPCTDVTGPSPEGIREPGTFSYSRVLVAGRLPFLSHMSPSCFMKPITS